MDGFPFTHRETARFRDLDPMGHVNNAVYGTKSFDLEYQLRSDDKVVAEAKTVLVAYDYESNQSKEIPEEWRRRLAA